MSLSEKSFSDIFTFIRASGSGRINASGQFEWVAANQPRFDYDPVTLQPMGILIEEQRTNLVKNSTMVGAASGSPGTLPTGWGFGSDASLGTVSRTINSITTENGYSVIEVRFQFTATGVGRLFFGLHNSGYASATPGLPYTAWAFVKWVAGNVPNVYFENVFRDGANAVVGDYFGTGMVPISSSSIGNPATFVSLINTAPANSASIDSRLSLQVTAAGSYDFTVRVAAPQVEQGSFATSHIPTSGSQVTRAADVCTANTLSPWYNPSEGVLFAEIMPMVGAVSGGSYPWPVCITSGNNQNELGFYHYAGGGLLNMKVTSNWVVSTDTTIKTGLTAGSVYKAALAYKQNDMMPAVNGVLGSQDTSGDMPISPNQMRLGTENSGAPVWNGWIRRIRMYPKRLSNAQLQSLTA